MPRHTVGLLALGLALLFVLSALQLGSSLRLQAARDDARRALFAEDRLTDTLRTLVDAEIGQRDFLLTGNERYLEPYYAAERALRTPPTRDDELLRGEPDRKELDRLIVQKLDTLSETIALQRAGAHTSAITRIESHRAKEIQEAIEKVVADMEATEETRIGRAEQLAHHTLLASEIALGVVVLIGFISLVLSRQMRRHLELCIVDLQRFASRTAHDIRNPIAAASVRIDTARRRITDAQALEDLERAQTTLVTMSKMVDGLLDFARAGGRPEEAGEANVAAVIRGVVAATQHTAGDTGTTLEIGEVCPTIVACSPGVLTSIVSNLVDNALKYLGDSRIRRVTVRATSKGAVTRLEVQDTGPGVPDAIRSAIFEPLVRGTPSSVQGLGIGLSTVRRLALAHGGAVGTLENLPIGSAFWVELPNAEPRRPSRVISAMTSSWKSLWMRRGAPRHG